MAESSLSVGFAELVGETGRFLGYGYKSYLSYTATQQAELNRIVQAGVRQVYYPPALNAGIVGYEWSWLRPTATLAIVAADGDYDLPDSFDHIVGSLNYAEDTYLAPIAVIGVNKILAMRAEKSMSGDPKYAATRYKTSTGTTGQRQEILFYPEPDTARTLSYEYEAYSGALSSAYPYPLGGMSLAELYIESCLAVAESRIEESPGTHTALFNALLVDRIMRDKKKSAKLFGRLGGGCDSQTDFKRGNTGSSYSITYKGVEL
jgi:hypothetical protein